MKVATFDEILAIKPATKYATVDAYGVTFRLGSLGADDILAWFAEVETPEGDKLSKEGENWSGLYLAARCIVAEDGTRFTDDQRAAFIAQMKKMDGKENRKLINAAQELTGVGKAAQVERKNGSSETTNAS